MPGFTYIAIAAGVGGRKVASILRAVGSALLLIVPSGSLASQTTPDRPPNIILLVIDDLGYNDIGPYGEMFADTPAVDRLAD